MISKAILFPYYITLKIRHRLYDKGKKKTYSFDVPVICIGNVTVGGTGKTPMTEYAVRLYSEKYKVAVLSLGYKRKSRGFILVNENDTAERVGDEPLQIKRKFPNIAVAVDKNRKRGIENLLSQTERPDVIILDDGFQRREILPAKNVFLVDYNRPIFKDELLPLGRLRDLPSQIRRAKAVVITKCPEYLDEWGRDKMRKITRIKPGQEVFFSKVRYCQPRAIFEGLGDPRYIYSKTVYLFTGIANARPLEEWLIGQYDHIVHEKFPDHHKFTRGDVRKIRSYAHKNPLSILLTTEKDAQRLLHCPYVPEELKVRLFYLPIETDFVTEDDKARFDKYLLDI